MHKETLYQQFAALLTPLCEEQNLVLWGIELALSSPKHRVVRIFIDAPGGTDQGVSIDMCAEFSRQASVLLDVEDLVPGTYNLEVSSPGLDRRFFAPHQLDAFLGQDVKLTLNAPKDGRKNFKGTLIKREGDTFTLRLDNDSKQQFSWDETRKLHLVFTG